METTTTLATNDVLIESSPQTTSTLQLQTKTITCYSEKLNLNFVVNIQNESAQAQQRCFIMTVHDLGYDCKSFFIILI